MSLTAPGIDCPGELLDGCEVFGEETCGIDTGHAMFLLERENGAHEMVGHTGRTSALDSSIGSITGVDAVEPRNVP